MILMVKEKQNEEADRPSPEQNVLADKLARGARTSPSAMVYVDSVLPKWLSDQESS
ncbi:hypothetical protein F2Q69_00055234 [Brassica cretica]|uniref:Uncharacterized protein n=1 Tax=Brassica cretica TaxID=69181 RepID=A0A8S9N013_BRACR|nr:hypothetical protein F2Q69_00055234 [Brassica cretica]